MVVRALYIRLMLSTANNPFTLSTRLNKFKGIPNFKETRIAMLRAETVKELFSILDYIRGNYGMNC